MYDNSRMPVYTNVSSRPCRVQYSRWSLNTPNTEITLSQTLPPATAAVSSSFYLPQIQRHKQKLTPNYVNLQSLPPSPPPPPTAAAPSSSSSSLSSNYQRPRSTIFPSFTSTDQSRFYVNDPQRCYESKTVVGIVKPMVHQRSYIQLNDNNDNNNNNNNNNNTIENKFPELMLDSYYHKSTRSLYPPPTPPISPLPPPPPFPSLSSSSSSTVSSVIYRSRPTPLYNNNNNNNNGQPPQVPRRYSSINSTKYLSSHRSSRSTSTSSSTAAVNELSSAISPYENEPLQHQLNNQEKNDIRSLIDVKRLEMFYGSVGTVVKSARSVVHLYTTTTRQLANFEDWPCHQFGVPIWIYNTGANLKRARQVRLLLAHHESCFAVWSNSISDQAEIRVPKDNHITCWLPDCYLLIVLKFEDDEACRLFFRHYYEILEHQRRKHPINSPPLFIEKAIQYPSQQKTNNSHSHKEIPRRYSRLRTISNKNDKDQQQQFQLRRCRSLSKIRTVRKSDISGPINFEHVNHISIGCHREHSLLGTVTLRSLHASMSHLPNNGTLMDRCTKSNQNTISTLFQPHTTTV